MNYQPENKKKKKKRKKFAHPGARKKKDKKDVLADKKKLVDHFRETIEEKFGKQGEEVYNSEKMTLPTMGQLTKTNFLGVNLLENNLSVVPVFPHKIKKNKFLLVICKQGEHKRYFLRRIPHVYTAGQIQPKKEVFNPSSRDFTKFQSNFLRFFIKRRFEQERNARLHIDEVKEVFEGLNDQNIKNQIKLCGGKSDLESPRTYYQSRECVYEQEEIGGESASVITPEDICLYERMHQCQAQLRKVGIYELKSTDKISDLRTKYYKKNVEIDDPPKNLLNLIFNSLIAKRIIEEVQLSAWNLSQNFLYCRNQQARMHLVGLGDPLRGLGGMNFIKLPQKISKYETMLLKNSTRGRNNDMVTGTMSDLRKLSMDEVHAKLKVHGYSEEQLGKLERWDKIDILRDLANKQSQNQLYNDDLVKYARTMRMTTDKQKEKYQKDINDLFMRQIKTLRKKGAVVEGHPPHGYPIGFEGVELALLERVNKLRSDLKKVKENKQQTVKDQIAEAQNSIQELRSMEKTVEQCTILPHQKEFFNSLLYEDMWWMFKQQYEELKQYRNMELAERYEQLNPKKKRTKKKAIVLKHMIRPSSG